LEGPEVAPTNSEIRALGARGGVEEQEVVLSHRPVPPAPWEREFFRLAASVLACHLIYAGGRFSGDSLSQYDPVSIMIGELSYIAEMHLLLKEVRCRATSSART
jgi:hypothetical protein